MPEVIMDNNQNIASVKKYNNSGAILTSDISYAVNGSITFTYSGDNITQMKEELGTTETQIDMEYVPGTSNVGSIFITVV
jgi:hypothetical protein